ncbi:MAG: DoxX family protein [Flavobacteriales bacterium]|nr:DoxX family protein [Flavobacteriales bacterium]
MRMLLNSDPISEDLGQLILRVSAGGTMFWHHGWPKLMSFSERADSFADPFGIGPTLSLVLILLAEVVCSALVVLGLWTRMATVPLIIGMAVIVFMVKGDAPFGESELALVYLFAFTTLLFTGSGRFSVDRISFG